MEQTRRPSRQSAFNSAHPTQARTRQLQLPEEVSEIPIPLQRPQRDEAAAPAEAADVQAAVGHYTEAAAERPVIDPQFIGPPTQQQQLDQEKQRLRQSMTAAQTLQGDERAQSIERALARTEQFSSQFYGGELGPDGKPVRHAVPPQLISTIRPLIEDLEKPVDGQTRPEGVDPEAARLGSHADWNSRLGVPEYRTQSDNLATPEGTCNVTSLAMVLERLGYSRADAMRAVERRLKKQYLAEKYKDQSVCTIDQPEQLDQMKLPDEVFQRAVKGYLDEQQGADRPYKRLRGEDTTDKERLQMSREFKDNAQYEDVLDLLRHVSHAGDRTEMGTVAPKLLAEIEPNEIKRPKIETINSGGWDGARDRIEDTLGLGGGVQLSFRHKGQKPGTHIVSVQDVTQDGLVTDDPYGKPNADYTGRRGDAYAPNNSTQRTAEYKNQVDRDPVGPADDGVGNDWHADRAQDLGAAESLGRSAEAPNSVYRNTWNYARLFTPKTQAEMQAEEAEKFWQLGLLKIPKNPTRTAQ
jgi:hypothetical protein